MALITWSHPMVERLKSRQPLNLKICKQLGEEFGISHMSVIQKAKSLDLEYKPVVREPKASKSQHTKYELVGLIEDALGLERTGAVTFDLKTLDLIHQRLTSK